MTVQTPEDEKKLEIRKSEVEKPSIKLFEGQQPSITVTVGAGDKAVTWNLPKGLLTHISPFFEAALKRPWLESSTESVSLPEDDPDAFRFFLKWLLQWTICRPGDYPKTVSHDDPDTTRHIYLRAWVFGDKMSCPRFQDFAYAHLTCVSGDVSQNLIADIYNMTSEGSTLRRWATFKVAQWIKECAFKSKTNETSEQYWADSIAAIEDLAADVVRAQILDLKEKPKELFLVSAREDYVFP